MIVYFQINENLILNSIKIFDFALQPRPNCKKQNKYTHFYDHTSLRIIYLKIKFFKYQYTLSAATEMYYYD